MLEKMNLFFATGAVEVWLCNEEGLMEFFIAENAPQPVPQSLMCPNFPLQIEID